MDIKSKILSKHTGHFEDLLAGDLKDALTTTATEAFGAMEEYASLNWISVKNKMPPSSFEQYIVFGDFVGENYMAEFVSIGKYYKGDWFTERHRDLDMVEINITHWMPIPPKPIE